jgi:hypothetical protein
MLLSFPAMVFKYSGQLISRHVHKLAKHAAYLKTCANFSRSLMRAMCSTYHFLINLVMKRLSLYILQRIMCKSELCRRIGRTLDMVYYIILYYIILYYIIYDIIYDHMI